MNTRQRDYKHRSFKPFVAINQNDKEYQQQTTAVPRKQITYFEV